MPVSLLKGLEAMIIKRVWPSKRVSDVFKVPLPTILLDVVQFGKELQLHYGLEECACSKQKVSVRFEGPWAAGIESSRSSQTTLYASLLLYR